MPDYNREAQRYDETRGGEARAAEAAAAVVRMLPRPSGVVLDVAGGTGIVAAVLSKLDHDVVVCDLSEGMLRQAQRRLPPRVVQADAAQLPFPDRGVAAVLMVWLLHLVDDAEAMVGEAVRVLRPGGRLITTVDKARAHGWQDRAPADAAEVVEKVAARLGLLPAAETTFVGVGQGRDRPDPVFTLRAFEKPVHDRLDTGGKP